MSDEDFDFINGDLSAADDAPAVETTPEAPKREPRMGVYVLKFGDSPASVARNLYGRPSRGRDLVLANLDVEWAEGSEIQIPD